MAAYAILLREGTKPSPCLHEEHALGLFAGATWLRLLAEPGLSPVAVPYRHSTFPPDAPRELFLRVKA